MICLKISLTMQPLFLIFVDTCLVTNINNIHVYQFSHTENCPKEPLAASFRKSYVTVWSCDFLGVLHWNFPGLLHLSYIKHIGNTFPMFLVLILAKDHWYMQGFNTRVWCIFSIYSNFLKWWFHCSKKSLMYLKVWYVNSNVPVLRINSCITIQFIPVCAKYIY